MRWAQQASGAQVLWSALDGQSLLKSVHKDNYHSYLTIMVFK